MPKPGEDADLKLPLDTEPVTGSIVAEISREVVRIHARYYGRGPTKARTIWRHGVVAVILEEIFTKAEVMLVETGHFDQVRSHRQVFQDQVEPLFRNVVEQATGRPVYAFLSQVSEQGVASEVFVLAGWDPRDPELLRRAASIPLSAGKAAERD